MAYTDLSSFDSDDEIKANKTNTLQDNIDDLRSRLAEASAWSWDNMPVSSGESVGGAQINELQDVLDDAHDKNNCQDCTDNSDRTDNDSDLYDEVDYSDWEDEYEYCTDRTDHTYTEDETDCFDNDPYCSRLTGG